MKHSLSSKERLKSRKLIADLFNDGDALFVYPLKMVFKKTELNDVALKVAVSVPKRLLKRAVDRNLVKRRIKESYRTAKVPLNTYLSENKTQLIFIFIYVGKGIEEFSKIDKSVKLLLDKLQRSL